MSPPTRAAETRPIKYTLAKPEWRGCVWPCYTGDETCPSVVPEALASLFVVAAGSTKLVVDPPVFEAFRSRLESSPAVPFGRRPCRGGDPSSYLREDTSSLICRQETRRFVPATERPESDSENIVPVANVCPGERSESDPRLPTQPMGPARARSVVSRSHCSIFFHPPDLCIPTQRRGEAGDVMRKSTKPRSDPDTTRAPTCRPPAPAAVHTGLLRLAKTARLVQTSALPTQIHTIPTPRRSMDTRHCKVNPTKILKDFASATI